MKMNFIRYANDEEAKDAIAEMLVDAVEYGLIKDDGQFTVDDIYRQALRYCSDKRISAVGATVIRGMFILTLLLVGKKAKGNLKQGYAFSYCFNCTHPELNGLGDVYIEKVNGEFVRVVGEPVIVF